MRFPKEIIDRELATASDSTRNILNSDEIAQKLASIGASHGLHIDQAGILDEETLYFALGLTSGDQFLQELEERLSIDREEAKKIIQDVNDQIFVSIRTAMQASQSGEAVTPAPTLADTEREKILAEIENPTPVQHPISAAQDAEAPAIPRAQEILPAPAPAAQKKPYVADPYREALN